MFNRLQIMKDRDFTNRIHGDRQFQSLSCFAIDRRSRRKMFDTLNEVELCWLLIHQASFFSRRWVGIASELCFLIYLKSYVSKILEQVSFYKCGKDVWSERVRFYKCYKNTLGWWVMVAFQKCWTMAKDSDCLSQMWEDSHINNVSFYEGGRVYPNV